MPRRRLSLRVAVSYLASLKDLKCGGHKWKTLAPNGGLTVCNNIFMVYDMWPVSGVPRLGAVILLVERLTAWHAHAKILAPKVESTYSKHIMRNILNNEG